jgi:hypothetical protein
MWPKGQVTNFELFCEPLRKSWTHVQWPLLSFLRLIHTLGSASAGLTCPRRSPSIFGSICHVTWCRPALSWPNCKVQNLENVHTCWKARKKIAEKYLIFLTKTIYSQPKKVIIFFILGTFKSSINLQSQILFVLVLLVNVVAKGYIGLYLRQIVHYHKIWNVRHYFVTTRWVKIMITFFGCE